MEIQDAKYGARPAMSSVKSGITPPFNQSFARVLEEESNQTEFKKGVSSRPYFECITHHENDPQVLGSITGGATAPISINDLIAKRDDVMDIFQNQTMSLFGRYGVDTSREIQLDSDESGHVRVAGDHPDKEKIERIFQDNPELANLYRAISATQSIIQAYEESADFRKMYADDPKQAVETYAYLFDDNRNVSDQFAIKIVDGQVVVG